MLDVRNGPIFRGRRGRYYFVYSVIKQGVAIWIMCAQHVNQMKIKQKKRNANELLLGPITNVFQIPAAGDGGRLSTETLEGYAGMIYTSAVRESSVPT